MVRIARKECEFDAGVADWDVHRLALVLDLDDVDPLGRKQIEELRELAGLIRELRAEEAES